MAIVAYDGLSGSGKSTFVGMLGESARAYGQNCLIISENREDPLRNMTAALARTLLQEHRPLEDVIREFVPRTDVQLVAVNEAYTYSTSWSGRAREQAFLAYLFAYGRRHVEWEIRRQEPDYDLIILDRNQVTGWAYQSDLPDYGWQEIRSLNADFGIRLPDIQIFLSCPVNQIGPRRELRQKLATGTAGLMSGNKARQQEILEVFRVIYPALQAEGHACNWFENQGSPSAEMADQVAQATLVFVDIAEWLAKKGVKLTKLPLSYWTAPEVLERLWRQQTLR